MGPAWAEHSHCATDALPSLDHAGNGDEGGGGVVDDERGRQDVGGVASAAGLDEQAGGAVAEGGGVEGELDDAAGARGLAEALASAAVGAGAEELDRQVLARRLDGDGGPERLLATLTPQDSVNRGMARPCNCDIVVVVLWSRMGTPLASSETRCPPRTIPAAPFRCGRPRLKSLLPSR